MTTRKWAVAWDAVHEERRALLTDLAAVSPEQWAKESLCAGWDVHDAVAHLVDSAKTTRLGFLRRLVAARFDFDRDGRPGSGIPRGRPALNRE